MKIDIYDLVEVTPYDHIKRGDLVMVWDEDPYTAVLRRFIKVDETRVWKFVASNAMSPGNVPLCEWKNCMAVEDYAKEYLK